MNTQLSSPIQDKNGNLEFSLEGRTYSLNVNSKAEREQVKKEINANSLAKYKWFKEETGLNHWVLYNTKMCEVKETFDRSRYLHYREGSALAPVIPINATSCHAMFRDCSNLTQIDLSNFDTSQVNGMRFMFGYCKALTQLDLSSFDTSKVIYMDSMFRGCKALIQLDLSGFITGDIVDMSEMFSGCSNLMQLDLSNFNTFKVIYMWRMFEDCKKLTTIYISDKWNIDSVKYSGYMFNDCYSLPNFSQEKTDIEMAKPIEDGGYLTLKN